MTYSSKDIKTAEDLAYRCYKDVKKNRWGNYRKSVRDWIQDHRDELDQHPIFNAWDLVNSKNPSLFIQEVWSGEYDENDIKIGKGGGVIRGVLQAGELQSKMVDEDALCCLRPCSDDIPIGSSLVCVILIMPTGQSFFANTVTDKRNLLALYNQSYSRTRKTNPKLMCVAWSMAITCI